MSKIKWKFLGKTNESRRIIIAQRVEGLTLTAPLYLYPRSCSPHGMWWDVRNGMLFMTKYFGNILIFSFLSSAWIHFPGIFPSVSYCLWLSPHTRSRHFNESNFSSYYLISCYKKISEWMSHHISLMARHLKTILIFDTQNGWIGWVGHWHREHLLSEFCY